MSKLDEKLLFRLWAKDPALFKNKPMLDWLDEPQAMLSSLASYEQVASLALARFSHVVLLGMGGSSASAKMFKEILAPSSSFLILDSIHPEAVKSVEEAIDVNKSLFIVASKSGSTMEPLLLYQHFLKKLTSTDPYSHFMAITDPISDLEQESMEKGFLHAPLAKPGIGGRYSGLSVFGILPALLMGIDVKPLLRSAILMSKNTSFSVSIDQNPAVTLAQVLVRANQKKLFIYLSLSLKPMATWLLQLIAESLGKEDQGVVPIITDGPCDIAITLNGEPTPEVSKLSMSIPSFLDLGGLMFRWQMGVALAGVLLNIDPFDQPDVERSKELAREIIDKLLKGQKIADETPEHAHDFLEPASKDYCAILSYLAEDKKTMSELLKLKEAIAPFFKQAVMLEVGPRYLHSTGQLFKGGVNCGRFLLITADAKNDYLKSYGDLSMGQIHLSQALGDLKALKERGRKVLHLHLKDPLINSQKIMGELCKSH